MGDRYYLQYTCKCGHFDDVYYAPTCGFTDWTCPDCGFVLDLVEHTGISHEEASNIDEIREMLDKRVINRLLVDINAKRIGDAREWLDTHDDIGDGAHDIIRSLKVELELVNKINSCKGIEERVYKQVVLKLMEDRDERIGILVEAHERQRFDSDYCYVCDQYQHVDNCAAQQNWKPAGENGGDDD